MTVSAFSGNPYLISPQLLHDQGLLPYEAIADPPSFSADRVSYNEVLPYKRRLLRLAFEEYQKQQSDEDALFQESNARWLDEYAVFVALKEAHGNRPWTTWEPDLARREPCVLRDWSRKLSQEVAFWKFVQFQFWQQWSSLRKYCSQHRVQLIGDIPIYVAHDSADVWAHPDLFLLDATGNPHAVAGVPPDYFSSSGQRWGNPLYNWEELKGKNYGWWVERFRKNFEYVDILRLDHFRGFEGYWEILAHEQDAVQGRWVKGPGHDFFESMVASLGTLRVVAEDLGVITPEVDALRDDFGFPGMRILQMAFGNDPKAAEYRPHNYPKNCVVYTASHDHNTTVGWFTAAPGTQSTQSTDEIARERAYALAYTGSDGSQIHWDFIRLALASVADMAVIPLQDVLGLGTDARMNRPGTAEGNWEWRLAPGELTADLQQRLRALTDLFERNGRSS
jgi:4-alpha-glucanotransferase